MALERTAKNLGVDLIHLPLDIGMNKKEWKSEKTGRFVPVENAVLEYYQLQGWNGYAGEGGLILNLIKAMSFPSIDIRHRATYIEALYAKNVSFNEDCFDKDWLISNVKKANRDQIVKNYKVMSSHQEHTIDFGCFTSTSSTSMLDFFPSLTETMFVELYSSLGNRKLAEIAEVFSSEPYEYRKGWPDLTIWKNDEVKFLEVKAPGDRLQKSQKLIINKFMKPLELNFALVDVILRK